MVAFYIWISDAIEKRISATKIISHHYLNGSWFCNSLSCQPKQKTISTLPVRARHETKPPPLSLSRRTHATTHVTDSPSLSKLLYHVVPELASHSNAPNTKRDRFNGECGTAQLKIYSELENTTGNGATDTVAFRSATGSINMAKEIK